MRLKDGWKDVEAAIHCAEWLTLIGGSSNAERRVQYDPMLFPFTIAPCCIRSVSFFVISTRQDGR
jgi:hypothetical protein